MSILDFIQAGGDEEEPISALGASMAPREGGFDSDSDFETHGTMANIGPKIKTNDFSKKNTTPFDRYPKLERILDDHHNFLIDNENFMIEEYRKAKNDEKVKANKILDEKQRAERLSQIELEYMNKLRPKIPKSKDKWSKTKQAQDFIADYLKAQKSKKADQKAEQNKIKQRLERKKKAQKYALEITEEMRGELELWSAGKAKRNKKTTNSIFKSTRKLFQTPKFQDVYNAAEDCISDVKEKILRSGKKDLHQYRPEVIYPLIQFRCLLALGHDIYADSSLFEEEYQMIFQAIQDSKYKTFDDGFFTFVDDVIRSFAYFKGTGVFKYRHDIGFVDPNTGENKPLPPFIFTDEKGMEKPYRVWQPLPGGIIYDYDGALRDKILTGWRDPININKFMFDVFYGPGFRYNEWHEMDENYGAIKEKAEKEGYAVDEVEFKKNILPLGEPRQRFRLRPLRPNYVAEREARFKREITTIKRANRGNKGQLKKLDEEYRQKVKHEGISDDEDEEGVILEETENVQVGDERNGYKVTEIYYKKNGDQIINWEEINDEDDLAYYNDEEMEVEKKINLRTRVQIGMSMSKRRAPTRHDRVLDVNEDLASLIDMMIL